RTPEAAGSDEAFRAARRASHVALLGLFITGCVIDVVLLIVLSVVVATRQAPADQVAQPTPWEPPSVAALPPRPEPAVPPPVLPEPVPEPEPPPPTNQQRETRLTELREREQKELAPWLAKLEKHKQALAALSAKEDALFPKGTKFNKKQLATFASRLAKFAKEQELIVVPIARDVARLARAQEEHLQARRRILRDHPEPGEPQWELVGELLLTPEEALDLEQRRLRFATPRAAATDYLKSEAAAALVQGPFYLGTLQDPADPALVAVAYRTQSYRGQTAVEIPVYLFLHQWRGVWTVVDLPGRAAAVLPGAPPGTYQPAAAGRVPGEQSRVAAAGAR
ncbi:MAG: hypothetical protein NZO58_12380, partial [Gemmataceae bacterium]|nr:hypothetical protein [Gemmataceae bacterium]